MPKRTPLYDKHNQLGAKLIDFGGWEMPVLYTGISAEHKAVRNKCGLFDVSHMGEVRVGGPAAARFLNGILTNDVERLSEGEGQYTIFCNEQGGIIDDLFLFRIDDDEFLLVVNAARREVDIERLRGCLDGFEGKEDVVLKDISDDTGMLAIQGPKAVDFIDAVITSRGCCCLSRAVSSLKRNQIGAFQFGGESVWISRTGYTGEDGFEVLAPVQVLSQLWERLLEVGGEYGLVPVGLG
ncbi:MAG: glycine cleavage system aminomethyltransferase GcvT, partial [Verrucomicrobia bacterium]|nr:glycine cleavage system aminomethyltransferase GcvT [Verrucomicrobiota bacterium]